MEGYDRTRDLRIQRRLKNGLLLTPLTMLGDADSSELAETNWTLLQSRTREGCACSCCA